MAGNVYLRTNRFEVKLEGITFKTKDFEYLCEMDFLFPAGRIWDRPPIIGLDVMLHPRDPSVLLLLLCFGVGCVILKFHEGESMPASIHKFLSDKRIHFVGFGIPEKKELFPFEGLGLRKNRVDIGYLAAKILNDPKYTKWELAQLARKVLGVKKMVGLTEASSFVRHEQIKCAICQLFITTVIAMGLLRANDKKGGGSMMGSPSKKVSFLNNMNFLHLLAEGWSKLQTKGKKNHDDVMKNQAEEAEQESVYVHVGETGEEEGHHRSYSDKMNYLFSTKFQEGDSGDDSLNSKMDKEDYSADEGESDDKDAASFNESFEFAKVSPCMNKKPLKGILKFPSIRLQSCDSSPFESLSPSTLATPRDVMAIKLRLANSKGCNVRFEV